MESHPESGADITSLSHQQTNVPSPPPPGGGADRAFLIPMAGSGAKPKSGVSLQIIIMCTQLQGIHIKRVEIQAKQGLLYMGIWTRVSYFVHLFGIHFANLGKLMELGGVRVFGYNSQNIPGGPIG